MQINPTITSGYPHRKGILPGIIACRMRQRGDLNGWEAEIKKVCNHDLTGMQNVLHICPQATIIRVIPPTSSYLVLLCKIPA